MDASCININDATGLRKLDEFCEELAAVGVTVYIARAKQHLGYFFNDEFVQERLEKGKRHRFQTLKPATNAYLKYQRSEGRTLVDTNEADPRSEDSGSNDQEWRGPVELPRMEKQNIAPAPAKDELRTRSDNTSDKRDCSTVCQSHPDCDVEN